jgi:hypothetical protein
VIGRLEQNGGWSGRSIHGSGRLRRGRGRDGLSLAKVRSPGIIGTDSIDASPEYVDALLEYVEASPEYVAASSEYVEALLEYVDALPAYVKCTVRECRSA